MNIHTNFFLATILNNTAGLLTQQLPNMAYKQFAGDLKYMEKCVGYVEILKSLADVYERVIQPVSPGIRR